MEVSQLGRFHFSYAFGLAPFPAIPLRGPGERRYMNHESSLVRGVQRPSLHLPQNQTRLAAGRLHESQAAFVVRNTGNAVAAINVCPLGRSI